MKMQYWHCPIIRRQDIRAIITFDTIRSWVATLAWTSFISAGIARELTRNLSRDGQISSSLTIHRDCFNSNSKNTKNKQLKSRRSGTLPLKDTNAADLKERRTTDHISNQNQTAFNCCFNLTSTTNAERRKLENPKSGTLKLRSHSPRCCEWAARLAKHETLAKQ